MTELETAHAGTTRWNVVCLALFAGIFGAFQNGKMPATLPTLTAELGLSLVQAGFAVSLLFAVACVIGLVVGAVADDVGARRIIIVGLVITALASAAGGFASGPVGLFASRLAEGLGVTAVFVAAPSMILRATAPRHQRLAVGIWSGYMPAGVAIMILITPAAIALIGWRGLWWLNGALLLAMAAVFHAATRGAPDSAGARGGLARLGANVRAVLGARGAWLLAFCFTLYTAMYLCVSSFLPTLLITTAGFAAAWAGTATALVVALNVFGNLLGGILLQRGVPRGTLIAIGAATMGTMSMVVYATDLAAAWKLAAAAAFSFVGGLLPSSIMAGAPVHAPTPAQVGATNGIILQLGNGGQLAGPPIFAALATVGGWSMAAWFTFALGLVAVAFGLAIGLHEKRRAAPR
jgi:MFS family permease